MKNIFNIKSLPPANVLLDLADCFGVKCTQRCDEYLLKIPPKWGSGFIKGIGFKSGIGLIEFDCKFSSDLEIHFIIDQIHPLKFLYCIEGIIRHKFIDETEFHTLLKYQNSIVGSQGKTGHILSFSAAEKIHLCSLEIDRAQFIPQIACYLKSPENALQEALNDPLSRTSFYHLGHYSINIGLFIKEMGKVNFDRLAKRIFLEAKSYQILSNQMQLYKDDLEMDGEKIIRQSEIQNILNAAGIIDLELEQLESIPSLAKRVGLNPNKLQNGFQHLYSVSVNGYIQKERMRLAVQLLQHSDKSMREIMEKLGLNSQSYFSKIFRDKFGKTPSDFRQDSQAKRN